MAATPSPAGDGSKTFTLASIMNESDDDLSDVELDAVGHPVISNPVQLLRDTSLVLCPLNCDIFHSV